MKKRSYLEEQLIDFVDVYKKFLLKTSSVTITYSIFVFVLIGILLKFSDFDPSITKTPISLLSYFFVSYSKGNTYSLVDLSKPVLFFFISIFSISMIRISNKTDEVKEYKFSKLNKYIYFMDIVYLFGVLLTCALLDYLLFQLNSFSKTSVENLALYTWFHCKLPRNETI